MKFRRCRRNCRRAFCVCLQEREYRPLGSTKTFEADFRVIAATNRPVHQALAENRLRSDLYYRLNTFQIELPPLRERKEDIPPLVATFSSVSRNNSERPEPDDCAGGVPEAARLRLAGECARTAKHDGVCRRPRATKPDQVKELPGEVQLPVALQKTERAANANGSRQVRSLNDMERNAILDALAQCHGNKKKAAELLGIQRPTLYNKMKRYAIEL